MKKNSPKSRFTRINTRFFLICLGLIFLIGFLWFWFNLGLFKTKPNSSATINGHRLELEIADDQEERARGLSGRHFLPENKGMLFVFDQKGFYSFWMRGMNFGLDFIFIDGEEVVGLVEKVPPASSEADLRPILAKKKFDRVIEVNQGVVAKTGIKVGDKVKFFSLD